MRHSAFLAIAMLGGLLSLATGTPAAAAAGECFSVRDIGNWKSPDDKTIYFRMGLSRVVRLDLSARCSTLHEPGAHLVTRFHGSFVCSPLDWELSVAQDTPGFSQGCIVKSMTTLTADEAAAIPRKFKP